MKPIDIATPFPGALCLLADSTPSTQAEARRLAEGRRLPGQAFPSGSLVAAEAQTAGRGRFPRRSWESEAGKNLLFTVFLESGAARLPEGGLLPGLPVRIGCALCHAASDYVQGLGLRLPAPPRVKWPNDLMIGDRKAAGILCEAWTEGVLAGVGLNCNQVAFPPGLAGKATSLALELGREVDRWALLELFLARLAQALGDAEWRREAEALLWKRGEAAAFLPGSEGSREEDGKGALVGIAEGIDEEGSLLFRATGDPRARAYAAGEFRAAGLS